MRQSGRLALILATQLWGVPLVVYGQTQPRGRNPSPPTSNAGAGAEDEEDDAEEEDDAASAPRTGGGGASGSGGAGRSRGGSDNEDQEGEGEDETGNGETPEAPAPAAAPETDDARRTRMLSRWSSLDGSIGLLHVTTAETGAAGSFRFGLLGEYFGASEFLRPTGLTGSMVTGPDSARHIGSTLTLSYSPLDFLELYANIRAYANSNSRERPSLFQVLGDTILGAKGAYTITRGFSLGGDAALYLLNRSGEIGLLGESTSFHLRALATLDLKELTGTVPLRLHLNLQYLFDNSGAIVRDVEGRRQMNQPGWTPTLCTDAATANNPICHLEVSRIERHALGINRVDRFGINLGVDADLPYVRPFLEWSVGVPVNRQSYQCFDPGGRPGPGGATDDDLCLANTGFSSIPSRISIGARVLPPVRGLSAVLAFDIATSGSSSFVRELSPSNPWLFYLGTAFAYDTHPQVQRVEVPGPERTVTRDVDRTPPGGHIAGRVTDAESHSGVTGAIVTFTGQNDMPLLATAADGRFRSGRIAPGEYRLHVTAPDYNPGDCTVTIAAPAAPSTPEGASDTAPAPSAAAADVEATVSCELRALPRRGNITGQVNAAGGASPGPVSGVTVVLEPAAGFQAPAGQSAPTTQNTTTDGEGRFSFNDLLAGGYSLRVEHGERTMASTPTPTNVEPRQTATQNLTVTGRPRVPSARIVGQVIQISRQVHFQTNSAQILPDSNTLLEEIADVLNRNPQLTAVEVQGHTDNQGAAAANMTLSQNRAEAVRQALVNLGVASDRLTARGYGLTRPIRPNLTVLGRTANRRVEFHITARAPRNP
ncbi:MAG: OmpA family protein [Deltaproteobacteria bacterium]|nr:OmpA family protein [Deltaproteobacteria bacterium]